MMEKAMAPHSSTLAWKIPWMEEPGRLQSMGSLRVGTAERLHFHFSLSCIGEGNGNPLQCSCLENPRNGEAWWAAVCGVAQSWTRLKQLSSSNPWWFPTWIINSHKNCLGLFLHACSFVSLSVSLSVSMSVPLCLSHTHAYKHTESFKFLNKFYLKY